jgi:hypothetical protein
MFQAWHKLLGEKPQPQFLLRDDQGREFGVMEYYSDRPTTPFLWVGFEFFSVDFSAARPWVVFDLEAWKVVPGKGKNLPDDLFEPGLQAYLDKWPEKERQLRKDRAKRGFYSQLIDLAEKGYTIAFSELFPGESTPKGLPHCLVAGVGLRVDDQYGIRPGEFRSEVSLVLIPEAASGQPEPKPVAIVNWVFGQGLEVLDAQMDEDAIAKGIQEFMSSENREVTYRERLKQMRREGVLLGVRPNLSIDGKTTS